MITGIERFDSFFKGGVPDGILIDVFGSHGTGKTQLALHTAVHMTSRHSRVLFQDTTGAFRPERMLEIIRANGQSPGLLDMVAVSRVTNVSEQINSIAKICPEDFSLVIIDGISDLFSFEYDAEDRFAARNRIFLRYMKALSRFAVDSNTTVMLTNAVRNIGDRQVENFEKTADLFTHVKVRMEKAGDARRCTCYTAFGQNIFDFDIGPGGIKADYS